MLASRGSTRALVSLRCGKLWHATFRAWTVSRWWFGTFLVFSMYFSIYLRYYLLGGGLEQDIVFGGKFKSSQPTRNHQAGILIGNNICGIYIYIYIGNGIIIPICWSPIFQRGRKQKTTRFVFGSKSRRSWTPESYFFKAGFTLWLWLT